MSFGDYARGASGVLDDVAGLQLPAAARLDAVVDAHQTLGDHRLGVGSAVDQIRQLEELTESDRRAAGQIDHYILNTVSHGNQANDSALMAD